MCVLAGHSNQSYLLNEHQQNVHSSTSPHPLLYYRVCGGWEGWQDSSVAYIRGTEIIAQQRNVGILFALRTKTGMQDVAEKLIIFICKIN